MQWIFLDDFVVGLAQGARNCSEVVFLNEFWKCFIGMGLCADILVFFDRCGCSLPDICCLLHVFVALSLLTPHSFGGL